MKTIVDGHNRLMRHGSVLMMVCAALMMVSCAPQDEELQRQIIETRAALDARTKALEQVQSQIAELQSQRPRSGDAAGSGEELAKAKATIADLTRQLESLRAQSAGASQKSTASAPMQLDLDAMAVKLEEDLTRKAKQLRELVQKQSPNSRIDEISMKSIQYPAELVTPFNSAITFSIAMQGGRSIRLVFPVTADLGGSWKLPGPDEVQQAYKAAQEQPEGVALSGGATPVQPGGNAQSSQPQASGGRGSSMRQVDANTFVFDWGDGPTAQQPRQAQATAPPQSVTPRSASVGGGQTLNNFTPPGQIAPQPPLSAPTQPSASPQPSSVPAPVMPVVGDRVIRFND